MEKVKSYKNILLHVPHSSTSFPKWSKFSFHDLDYEERRMDSKKELSESNKQMLLAVNESIQEVQYAGTMEQANAITIGTDNESLDSASWLYNMSWSQPTYLWSDDLTNVTASRYFKADTSRTEEETVAVTAEITKAATCTEMGETTYTSAEFENALDVSSESKPVTDKMNQTVTKAEA